MYFFWHGPNIFSLDLSLWIFRVERTSAPHRCIFSRKIHFWMFWERLATLSIDLDGLKSSHDRVWRWKSMKNQWKSLENQSKSMKINEIQWFSLSFIDFHWIFIDFHLHARSCDDFNPCKSIDRVLRRC